MDALSSSRPVAPEPGYNTSLRGTPAISQLAGSPRPRSPMPDKRTFPPGTSDRGFAHSRSPTKRSADGPRPGSFDDASVSAEADFNVGRRLWVSTSGTALHGNVKSPPSGVARPPDHVGEAIRDMLAMQK